MNNKQSSSGIANMIWLLTNLLLSFGYFLYSLLNQEHDIIYVLLFVFIVSSIITIPVLIALSVFINHTEKLDLSKEQKQYRLYICCLICVIPYGLLGGAIICNNDNYFLYVLLSVMILFLCSLIAIFLIHHKINNYFSSTQNINCMEQNQMNESGNESLTQTSERVFVSDTRTNTSDPLTSNKTLIKGFITGALILLMLIPTVFVSNLVTEREKRHQDVVKEVANGWSAPQTLSGPYLVIPYQEKFTDDKGKESTSTKQLFILPENLTVDGTIIPEVRPRSIYKVVLYRSDIKNSGNFKIDLPKDIDINSLMLSDAKVCYELSDFKGIEEKIFVNLNGTKYDLLPGLPAKVVETINAPNTNAGSDDVNRTETATRQIESIGLSASIVLTKEDLLKPINFDMQLKIKGSEELHFIPLSGNSNFNLTSTWQSPKFDGSNLPNTREISDKGFTAKWSFNNANLPFGTVLKDFNIGKHSFAFGVGMLQPTDQYAKTMRSVKYAILFIGLTFALFFIIELMQKKPMHPVQYVLIGIALVIFFTLLLSISEFIVFDFAYLIAASLTILLITLYAKSHFKSVKSAATFGSLLTCLYAFIFVLIRLEDAALLVGSIGLFIILAMVMFGSRKINWYGSSNN